MENIPTTVELHTRVVGKQIKSMEMEFTPSQMESDMKVSMRMEFDTELESTSTNVEMYMMGHGLMIIDMEKLTTHLQMVRRRREYSMKEILKNGLSESNTIFNQWKHESTLVQNGSLCLQS